MTTPYSKPEAATHDEQAFVRAHDEAEAAVDRNIHHTTSLWGWRLFMNMFIVGLSLGLFGYDNSFVAPLLSLPYFISKYQGIEQGPAFTARNLDVIATVPLVGAACGTFVSVPLMKIIGRKKTLMLAYFFLCTPGSLLQLFAPNLGALVVGRLWNYIGISILTTTAPLYLTELVPAHIRARAVGFCVAGVSAVGIIATTVVWGTEKIAGDRSFKIPLAIQAACPVSFGFLTLLCVESPLWDIQHGRMDHARQSLMKIRKNNAEVVEAELSMYHAAVKAEAELRKQTRFWDILHPKYLKRTLTAGALLCASQVGGQILVLTYSTVILVQSGVANPFQITIIITCLQFLGTILGPILVDKLGRRPVAMVGFSILFALNMAAGSLAATGLTTQSQRLGLAAVFIIFAFFNAASFQALAFLLPTEIPTPALREPTMAWATFWSYVTAIITTFAVPQITSPDAGNLGAKTSFIFGGCIFITVIWTYFYIPETKSRTPLEIDEMYDIKLPMRKWRNYNCKAVHNVAEEVRRRSVTPSSKLDEKTF